MDARDLGVTKLANLTGLDKGYISNLRSGKRENPSDDVVQKIADVLKVNVVWMLTGQGEMFAASTHISTPSPHPLDVAETDGAVDEEERTLDEIRVRIHQFKHSDRKRRDLYSQQIMNRVQEYNDWCETFAKPVRDSQLPHARQHSPDSAFPR